MNRERLLNVAKALRESPAPGDFTMRCYRNHCGTPACALGHYAARVDLQDVFEFDGGFVASVVTGTDIDLDDPEVCEHFGISRCEAVELFGSHGCGGACTTLEAAEYIEYFVTRCEVLS